LIICCCVIIRASDCLDWSWKNRIVKVSTRVASWKNLTSWKNTLPRERILTYFKIYIQFIPRLIPIKVKDKLSLHWTDHLWSDL